MNMPNITGRQLVRGAAFVVLLVGPLVFGVMGKAAEAAIVIVSAAMALAFSDIERFASLKGAGFEATFRDMENKVEALTEKQTEPTDADEQDEADAAPLVDPFDSEAKAVLDALDHPEYTWRYLSGIRKETKLPDFKIRRALGWLVSHNYARISEGKHGPIWSITEEARQARLARGADLFEDVSQQPPAPVG